MTCMIASSLRYPATFERSKKRTWYLPSVITGRIAAQVEQGLFITPVKPINHITALVEEGRDEL